MSLILPLILFGDISAGIRMTAFMWLELMVLRHILGGIEEDKRKKNANSK